MISGSGLTQRAPDPRASAGAGVVGLLPEGTAWAFSGSLRGLELVPAKWHPLVLPTSTAQGHNAHRWTQLLSRLGILILGG